MSNSKPKVGIVSPTPATGTNGSGVAPYVAALCTHLSSDFETFVLAQRSARREPLGHADVIPCWGMRGDVAKAVWSVARRQDLDLVHVQHEFNLFGGTAQSALLIPPMMALRRVGVKVVTTLHGVLDHADVTEDLLALHGLPKSVRLARAALQANYRLLGAASDVVVVHHDHFANTLAEVYGFNRSKVAVVPHGAIVPQSDSTEPRQRSGQVLVLGYLTSYKLPELVAHVAESDALPDLEFRFCIGLSPSNTGQRQVHRYERLSSRVGVLGPRARWDGYIPDDELDAAFRAADVVVLPYQKCVSASGVAGLAYRNNTTICYSRPLRPMFGASRLEFELEPDSLVRALRFAVGGDTNGTISFLTPWDVAAKQTEQIWRDLLSR